MGFNPFANKKGDIIMDTSPSNTKESPFVLESRHAPFLFFPLIADNLDLSSFKIHLLASTLKEAGANI